MTIYVTSDLHLGHKRILEICPNRLSLGSTVEEHDEALINNHNSIVSEEDTVIWIGDLIMGSKIVNVPLYLPRLQGIKILLPGNHDYLPSKIKTDGKLKFYEELYLSNGISQIAYGTVSLSRFTNNSSHDKILLSHFPPISTKHVNKTEDQYTKLQHILQDNEYMLVGHCHSTQHLLQERVYHVGIDATIHAYSPVALELILQRLNIK